MSGPASFACWNCGESRNVCHARARFKCCARCDHAPGQAAEGQPRNKRCVRACSSCDGSDDLCACACHLPKESRPAPAPAGEQRRCLQCGCTASNHCGPGGQCAKCDCGGFSVLVPDPQPAAAAPCGELSEEMLREFERELQTARRLDRPDCLGLIAEIRRLRAPTDPGEELRLLQQSGQVFLRLMPWGFRAWIEYEPMKDGVVKRVNLGDKNTLREVLARLDALRAGEP